MLEMVVRHCDSNFRSGSEKHSQIKKKLPTKAGKYIVWRLYHLKLEKLFWKKKLVIQNIMVQQAQNKTTNTHTHAKQLQRTTTKINEDD